MLFALLHPFTGQCGTVSKITFAIDYVPSREQFLAQKHIPSLHSKSLFSIFFHFLSIFCRYISHTQVIYMMEDETRKTCLPIIYTNCSTLRCWREEYLKGVVNSDVINQLRLQVLINTAFMFRQQIPG